MFFFFSNPLGCIGSMVVSARVTLFLLFLFAVPLSSPQPRILQLQPRARAVGRVAAGAAAMMTRVPRRPASRRGKA